MKLWKHIHRLTSKPAPKWLRRQWKHRTAPPTPSKRKAMWFYINRSVVTQAEIIRIARENP